MKRILLYVLPLALLTTLFSCQKEYSFENDQNVAQGSLQSDATDECLPKTITGSYVAGKALHPDSNYIDVQIDIASSGSYTVYTDTVNGYWFRATGSVNSTGITSIRIKGQGTPLTAGVNTFTVMFDSTFCYVQVTVLPSGSTGGPAVFTFEEGGGGNCVDANIQGTYVVGTALAAANKVDIKVNVTTVGTYNITTGPVNGMTFSGSGTFSTTGVQVITLNGTGTPTSAGLTPFPLTAGTSNCTFSVTVNPTTPPPPVGDYFPTTANSNWSYELDDEPLDSLLRKALSSTHSAGGNTYTIFMITDDAAMGFDSSGYYRKATGNYYEWIDFGSWYGFDDEHWAEYIFLKDNQPATTVWFGPEISGTVSGTPITAREKFTILQKDVTVTVNTTSYPNTIVVEQITQQQVGPNWVDQPGFGVVTSYYAKGVGLVKQTFTSSLGTFDLEVRRHQVL